MIYIFCTVQNWCSVLLARWLTWSLRGHETTEFLFTVPILVLARKFTYEKIPSATSYVMSLRQTGDVAEVPRMKLVAPNHRKSVSHQSLLILCHTFTGAEMGTNKWLPTLASSTVVAVDTSMFPLMSYSTT